MPFTISEHLKTEFAETHKALLRNTLIDELHPGSLLQDFSTLLEFVRDSPVELTATHLLTTRSLNLVNSLLTRPIEHGMARPTQKTFHNVSGLYWLLRALGIAQVDNRNKKPTLSIDTDAYRSWQSLNHTEKYFMLLETWILRAAPEILGEHGGGFGGNRVLDGWNDLYERIPDAGVSLQEDQRLAERLRFLPGYPNLALLEMFGLLVVQSRPRIPGAGWQLARLARTPLGDAILPLLVKRAYGVPDIDDVEEGVEEIGESADDADGFLYRFERYEDFRIGFLQSTFQPYFPAWRNNLSLTQQESSEGKYIFTVALGKDVWRRIAIAGDALLEELSQAILDAYRFDSDHLDRFIYRNRFGSESFVNHPSMDDEPPWTDEVTVGSLALRVGDRMIYNFDFGDDWKFTVTLDEIAPVDKRLKGAKVIEKQGKAPKQYHDWG